MSAYEVNTTYEPFSREPEYIEANRAFLETAGEFAVTTRLLDLACGTGVMGGLLRDRHPALSAVGLDLSRESMLFARERFREAGQRDVPLVEGTADVLPFRARSFDGVVMGNAIHMVSDRERLIAEVARVLRPGGVFAFNSSFYAGTMVPGSERFYHEWVKQALLHVLEKDRRLRAAGRPGIPRQRGRVKPAFTARWPSAEEWRATLLAHGFQEPRFGERTVTMTPDSLRAIGSYGGLAEVLLSGYPVAEASEALQATVDPTLAGAGMSTVARYWLEVVSIRDPDTQKERQR